MIEIKRLGVQEARERCKSGAKLVCAYESEDHFDKYHLEGAISLNALRNLVPHVLKDAEMVFYCA